MKRREAEIAGNLPNVGQLSGFAFCRSELAREKRKDTALTQDASVIVDVLREQARSYKGSRSA